MTDIGRKVPVRAQRYDPGHCLGLIGIVVSTFIAFQYQKTRYFGPLELAATSGGVLLSLALWVRYSRRRSFDSLDPIHIVMGILLFGFCGVLVYDPSVHFTRFAEPERALIVSIVATLAFALGYTAFTDASSSRILPQRLMEDGTRVLGTILNKWDPRKTSHAGYAYAYRHYHYDANRG
jgi:hypothetical protein